MSWAVFYKSLEWSFLCRKDLYASKYWKLKNLKKNVQILLVVELLNFAKQLLCRLIHNKSNFISFSRNSVNFAAVSLKNEVFKMCWMNVWSYESYVKIRKSSWSEFYRGRYIKMTRPPPVWRHIIINKDVNKQITDYPTPCIDSTVILKQCVLSYRQTILHKVI